jgi:hypothetical protein
MNKYDEILNTLASDKQITAAYLEGLQSVKNLFSAQAIRLTELYLGEVKRIQSLEDFSRSLNARVSEVNSRVDDLIDAMLSITDGSSDELKDSRSDISKKP